jgi:ribosomal-protein-alanine N-acetyltransferase
VGGREVTLRDAVIGDIDALMAIERASFSVPWSEGSVFREIGADDGIFLVAERESRVVGFAIARLTVPDAELLNLAVEPQSRGFGVASELLREILARLETRGVTAVYLEVRQSNDAARRLYERHAFESVGRRRRYYDEPTEDAIVMRREIL